MREARLPRVATIKDSRRLHGELFQGLTPPHFPHFAGKYRGEPVPCLDIYEVKVGGDPRVGTQASRVPSEMQAFAENAHELVKAVEAIAASDEQNRRLRAVEIACLIFEVFLKIHPYANGNGHVARFVVWAVLGHFNYWPVRWRVDPRPDAPDYAEMIVRHRSGDREPLVRHVLACLVDAP